MQLEDFQRKTGIRVRQLREEKGWSQEEFADRCGVHRSYMGVVERGERNLTLSTLHKLASTLEISVAALLRGII
jgi:transcriptional regulator with XRE-family HTH domain